MTNITELTQVSRLAQFTPTARDPRGPSVRARTAIMELDQMLGNVTPIKRDEDVGKQPTLFELQGYGTKTTYSTTSVTGSPLLSYEDQHRDLQFSGAPDLLQGQMMTYSTLTLTGRARFVTF